MAGGRIYVDLDDVLGETARMFLELLAEEWGRRVEFESLTDFNLANSLEMAEEELGRFMDLAHQPRWLGGIEPIEGAIDGVRRWVDRGYELRVLTGRPADTEPVSRAWLERHRVPHAELGFVDKYSEILPWSAARASVRLLDAEAVGRMGFRLAVEDSLDFAAVLAGRYAIPVALLDRPWNRDEARLEPEARALVTRCRDWDEIVERFPAP